MHPPPPGLGQHAFLNQEGGVNWYWTMGTLNQQLNVQIVTVYNHIITQCSSKHDIFINMQIMFLIINFSFILSLQITRILKKLFNKPQPLLSVI